jgi:hypothetical protein
MKNEKKKKKRKARGIMIYHALILQQPPRETSITLTIVFFSSPTSSRVLCFILLFGIIAFAWFAALSAVFILKRWEECRNRVWRVHMNDKKKLWRGRNASLKRELLNDVMLAWNACCFKVCVIRMFVFVFLKKI